jgi:anti-anti-sigma factor
MRIDGELNIYRATELKELLLTPFYQGVSLEVDLSGVSEVDTAGVQLLMLAKRTAKEQGCELRLAAHSPAVVDVFELLDLAGVFGDPLLVPARAA